MTHIEADFDSIVWQPYFARCHATTRSSAMMPAATDRPRLAGRLFEDFVNDLESVVDAAGVDRFALHGLSQGCTVSIAYGWHPDGFRI